MSILEQAGEKMLQPIQKREEQLRQTAEEYGQGHLFSWWPQLTPEEKENLLYQIASIEFPLIHSLQKDLVRRPGNPEPVELEPAPIIFLPRTEEDHRARQAAAATGASALAEGRVAALLVAGGQGTRLGFDGPKGVFPIGPISNKSLFAFFAEKILASQKRYGRTFHWYIMTSPANDLETHSFFKKNDYFGLRKSQIFFFRQGTMPAVDHEGRILLSGKSEVALSPDGHGGTFKALAEGGALKDMEERGITEISYFQVDNVLVQVFDPVFVGYHLQAGAEMSSKVLRKAYPEEKMGVIGLRNGKLGVIEYSDLTSEDMYAKGPDGELKYWAGSIAVHMIRTAFIRRLQDSGTRLPFHRADKKVPYIDPRGNRVEPEKANGVKFESFIFDALGFAINPVTLEVERKLEFSPIKNATGVDSPEVARRDLMEMFASWLADAGAKVPRRQDGSLAVKIEISPLFALDREAAVRRLSPPPVIAGDLYLTGPA